jgi:hypothetical protein
VEREERGEDIKKKREQKMERGREREGGREEV